MKESLSIISIVIFVSLLTLSSCEKDENEVKISHYNESESHKAGQNCMSCHKSGGSGEGWFTVAGTVYDSLKISLYPNATVKLYTEPNGSGILKGTIQVDGLGNFYTTDHIDFSGGLYTSVAGDNDTKHMLSKITNGQCNSCRGSNTDRIWTK